ncbi:MAG: glutamine synthetase type III [Bacteroidetes bacterium 43-16]|nr:MAG: glutamine synthetase type III [Bacteroidetes bacterium 43-16]
MSANRFTSIDEVHMHSEKTIHDYSGKKITDFFACNVFNGNKVREYVSDEGYKSWQNSVKAGNKIDRKMADQIASGMKAWAMKNNATHYSHWFQPLTGTTAEKHDSFFTLKGDGTPLETFDGDALIQQEPDASSFPNGGIRATFEARGYTAWDPASPPFIMETAQGKTLCIPTIFVAYSGESLDYKAPLLKSIAVLDKAAVDVCNYFDKNVSKVSVTLGWEQEYFLIDEALADARPDIVQCGRALIGHAPAKGQQLEDHYFGAIPERVFAYMQDFEQEAYKLGIPLRTRHNEVAPGQFECAPIFEEVNVAVDHNSLLMDVMNRVAKRHKLKVLFHEKPFAGVNGSGKHNNWSLSTDTGINLLAPGKTPRTNLLFLTFFINVIKAVHDHADLLRAAIASEGNDYRLGANEAPPAIISVFIGKYLTEVLSEIKERVSGNFTEQDEVILKMDIHKHIPELLMDNTDRNRTSPFAFTGNKFEFRAVGSSANCGSPMSTLNTIMAKTLIEFKKEVDAKISSGEKKEIAILQVLRSYIKDSQNICFEGDNYSEEWAQEAKKRGLSNFKTTPEALDVLTKPETLKMFSEMGIYSERELHARHEIVLEEYVKRVQIEARVLGYLTTNHILPAAVEYQNSLIKNVKGLKELGLGEKTYAAQLNLVKVISGHIQEINDNVEAMIEERKKANKMDDMRKKADAYCTKIKVRFDKIRYHVDKLELFVDDKIWPMPKYREMLFLK